MAIFYNIVIASATIGAFIAISIWILQENSQWLIPWAVFNLTGILGIPGGIIVVVLTSIFRPMSTGRAVGLYPPYNYLSYAADFLFYFGLSYLILRQIRKHKEKGKNIEEQF